MMHGQELGVVGSIGYCRTTWDFDISVHFDTLTLTGNPLTCSNRRFRVQTRVQFKKKRLPFTACRVTRGCPPIHPSASRVSRLFDHSAISPAGFNFLLDFNCAGIFPRHDGTTRFAFA